MNVALPKEHVVDSIEFHLASILRFEQHSIPHLEGPNVRADRDHPRPGKAASDLCCGGDDDAAERPAFPPIAVLANENAIMQQLDRDGTGTTRYRIRKRGHVESASDACAAGSSAQ